jgi:CHC2 zinc finger
MSLRRQDRYQQLAQSSDRRLRLVAERQLARLQRRDPRSPSALRSSWVHVPLVDLFAQAGNALSPKSNGHVETGHEPMHGSRSGRCVLIDPKRGIWWCRSCRRGGDAASFLMALRGWDYRRAAEHLRWQYGTVRRPVLCVGGV